MTEIRKSVILSFYGFGINVGSDNPETVDNIRRDFSFFSDPDVKPEISIQVFDVMPERSSLPDLRPSLHSPRNFCYRQGNLLFIDYFGKGISIIDLEKKEYRIYSPDGTLRHEIVFLTILSLVGEDLDRRHIHRVHALGLEINGKSVLILLPSGGGKTTLMLELLKQEGVKLISEDTPLIDPSGNILPFPIRIGIDANGRQPDFPASYLRPIRRMEFGPKYLLDIEYFKDKIVKHACKPAFIFNGIRCLGNDPHATPASKLRMMRAFIANSVVGLGVYQGIEFLLEHSPFELIKKSGVAFSRLRNSWSVISRAHVYDFCTGSDIKKNCAVLTDIVNTSKTER